jgi:hypothetical protein
VSQLQPHDVLTQLRKNGITVHHAALDVLNPDRIVVYLEAGLGRAAAERAQDFAGQLPGICSTQFANTSKTILLLTRSP